MVQRIYNYSGLPGPAPAPAPAVPPPAANPPTPAPGAIFNTPINAYNWGDKMFGGGIKSMDDAQRMFDKIWQIDPRLAYNFLQETNSWTTPFAQNGLGGEMRPWIQQKYFGMNPNKYNTWINMSSPVGSNAHSITPQEKYWMYKMINEGNSAWGSELNDWFKNAPGGYYSGIDENWSPYKLGLEDLYGGTYQDGRGGAYNPAQLAANPPEGTLAGRLPNPYLGGAGETSPAGPPNRTPMGTPTPRTPGSVPTPAPTVPAPTSPPNRNAVPTITAPNTGITTTNPAGTPGGYRYNPSTRS